MTHNNELPEKVKDPLLKHKKSITIISFVLASITLGALGYEIFSPRGFNIYFVVERLKLLPRALMGDAESQHYIALTYYQRRKPDSEPDKNRFYWYMKAAEGGDRYGAYIIARYYERGYGVKQNRRKAMEWYPTRLWPG